MEVALAVMVMLIIILITVGVLCRRMLKYHSEHVNWRFPKALISHTEFYPGDILLFTPHTHGFVNSLFTQDFYTHGAIVVQDPTTGQLLISESMIGDEVMPHPSKEDVELVAGGKAVLLPLYARIKHYPGPVFLMRLTPGLTEEQSVKLWGLAQTQAPYPAFAHGLARLFGLDFMLKNNGRTYRHCMAHVAWILDQMGMTPMALLAQGKDTNSGTFLGTCKRITRIHGEPLGPYGDHEYLSPVHILYDIAPTQVPYIPPDDGEADQSKPDEFSKRRVSETPECGR